MEAIMRYCHVSTDATKVRVAVFLPNQHFYPAWAYKTKYSTKSTAEKNKNQVSLKA